MKIPNIINTPEADQRINFDALCQGFEGGSFYGLEYVLDDFLDNAQEKPQVSTLSGFDWFGLDS